MSDCVNEDNVRTDVLEHNQYIVVGLPFLSMDVFIESLLDMLYFHHVFIVKGAATHQVISSHVKNTLVVGAQDLSKFIELVDLNKVNEVLQIVSLQ